MPVPVPTPDEIVQLLKHTSMPTLLVEGPSDADLFRIIETRSGLLGGTVLSCGGRSALLQIYERRAEFSHLKCAFLADADMWHFGSVPPQYTGIIFTTGYAIENERARCRASPRAGRAGRVRSGGRLFVGVVCARSR